jgi:hypothetical protein
MDLCYPEESDIEWTPLAATICNGTQVIAVLPDPTCSGSFDPSLYDDIQSYVEELFNESGERDNEEDL